MTQPHGPDTQCNECVDCPVCEGVGFIDGGPTEILIQNHVVIARCAACRGAGVNCPNFDRF